MSYTSFFHCIYQKNGRVPLGKDFRRSLYGISFCLEVVTEKQLRLVQVEKDKEIQVQKELGVQVDCLTQLLHQEKRKQDEQKAQNLEALRPKYIAPRKERFVLDGDREELRAIK
ncbi:hypothetical protein H310_11373 [Aphanomyces invadans]|uniref:Uncharacterized protein n=1 Tax=Aphanomyces invadans TaxID=157072 RepID=A0A024TLP9_9STRA|nr:hypothetical protein H310_11373 [Aphanomyces invadans]ETV95090.1 hypothetical protein H310_11373 [Aphanomyces invadans]|eukprot:XP_008876263.1 hypothetical protein H310_11373 [Aphanomyces invadans]